MTRTCGCLILLLAVLAASAPSWGQVRILQSGQALDANPYVGSGGLNSTYSPLPLDSQLIVNRQVTGLGGFRGSVAYFPVDQLNLTLPSDMLDRFRGQSVGIPDVYRGNVYAPAPYMQSSRNVADLRYVLGGRLTGGIPTPPPPTPPGLFGQVGTISYVPPTPMTPQRVGWAWAQQPVGGSYLPVNDSVRSLITQRGSLDLFAVPDPAQRQQLARELGQVQMPGEQAVRREVETRTDPSAGITPPVQAPVEPMESNAPAPTTAYPTPPGVEALATPTNPDEDVFADLIAQTKTGRWVPRPPPRRSLLAPAPKAPEAAQPAPTGVRMDERPQVRKHPAAVEEFDPNKAPAPVGRGQLVEYSPQRGIVLHGLAGTGRDQFNTIMSAAGKYLKEGRFYEAADAYREAASINASNPLPRLGLSLSLFSAGESLGAAHQLKRAAEIYPPILTTRMDVADLTDPELLRRRLDFLAARLANVRTGPEPMLYFIAAYMHFTLDHLDQAREYALKLQELASEDDTLANFARFVLTRVPTSGPASQPASEPATAPATSPAP